MKKVLKQFAAKDIVSQIILSFIFICFAVIAVIVNYAIFTCIDFSADINIVANKILSAFMLEVIVAALSAIYYFLFNIDEV